MDETAEAPLILEANYAGNLGKEGIIFAAADIVARLQSCAALTDQDRAPRDRLPVKSFDTEPLGV